MKKEAEKREKISKREKRTEEIEKMEKAVRLEGKEEIKEFEEFEHLFLLNPKKIISIILIALLLFILNATTSGLGKSMQIVLFILIITLAIYIVSSIVFTLVLFFIEEHMLAKLKLKIKYPKFLLLIFTFVVAYFIFQNESLNFIFEFINSLGYFGNFLAGMLFTYGFTAGPAIAIFLLLAKDQNIFIAALIGGFGALCGNVIIFKLIRTSFNDEVKLLEHEAIIKHFEKRIPHSVKKYILPAIGGLILASPLPDEIGISMLAMLRNVSSRVFYIISYVMSTIGIFVVLLIGKSI